MSDSFFLPDCLELGRQLFPAFGLVLKPWLLPGLKLAGLQTETTPSAPLSLQLADCSSQDFLGSIIQFPIINLFLYVIHPTSSVSLESTNALLTNSNILCSETIHKSGT